MYAEVRKSLAVRVGNAPDFDFATLYRVSRMEKGKDLFTLGGWQITLQDQNWRIHNFGQTQVVLLFKFKIS